MESERPVKKSSNHHAKIGPVRIRTGASSALVAPAYPELRGASAGSFSESHLRQTGQAYWLPANPPNPMHADVNSGDKPIEVVVVELKKEK